MFVWLPSGQGFSREGVRFGNRLQANSGSKVFVTTLVEGSDKPLSLYQKQYLFSSHTGLRGMNTIQMGGKQRKLIKISSMDYEAQAEELGTQVCFWRNVFKIYVFNCVFWHSLCQKIDHNFCNKCVVENPCEEYVGGYFSISCFDLAHKIKLVHSLIVEWQRMNESSHRRGQCVLVWFLMSTFAIKMCWHFQQN